MRGQLRYDSAVLRGLAISCALTAGCTRDPAESICPDAASGALVVTEVRGDQDLNGPWVELYNASGRTLDLEGTRVRFRRLTGTDEIKVLIRRNLDVAAGGYVVLGLFSDEGPDKPDYVDYGFAGDFSDTWRASGVINVDACETALDVARHDSLPDEGTFSFGVDPPDAEANDDTTLWCTDPDPSGSPGEANPPCPPPT